MRLATLLLASSLIVMAAAAIAPALPAISYHFRETPNIDFWARSMITLPALFIAIGAWASGLLVDRYGRRKFLISGLIAYGAFGGAGLGIDSIMLMMLSRVGLGLSVGMIVTSTTTLIADYYSGQERHRVMGLQGAFAQIGGVFFIGLAGALVDLYWRAPFALYLLSWLIAYFVYRYLDPSPVVQRLKNEQAFPERVSLVLRGYRFDYYALMACGCFLMIVLYMIPTHMPFFLERRLEASSTEVGLSIAMLNLFAALSALLYKRLRLWIGCHRILGLSAFFMGAGFLLFAFAQSKFDVVVGMVTFGCGWGLVIPNIMVWVNQLASEARRGEAVGRVSTAFFSGQFLSPFFFDPLFRLFDPFRVIFFVGLSLLVLSIACIFWSVAYHKAQKTSSIP
tara:strand:+ start:1734 stop:2918 length:1185 start_codon:yes stop_codon:yes gene_type:complete